MGWRLSLVSTLIPRLESWKRHGYQQQVCPWKPCYFRDAELVNKSSHLMEAMVPKGEKYGDLGSLGDSEMLDFRNFMANYIKLSRFTIPETNSKSTWKLLLKKGLPPFPLGFGLVFVCYVQLRSQINVHIRSLLPANWKLKWWPLEPFLFQWGFFPLPW